MVGEVPTVGGHPREVRPLPLNLPLRGLPGQGGVLQPIRALGRLDAHVYLFSQVAQVHLRGTGMYMY